MQADAPTYRSAPAATPVVPVEAVPAAPCGKVWNSTLGLFVDASGSPAAMPAASAPVVFFYPTAPVATTPTATEPPRRRPWRRHVHRESTK